MGDRDSYLYDLYRGRTDQPVPEGVIDLGHDVLVHFTVRGEDETVVGLIETHPTPDGQGCHGGVVFDVPEAEGLNGARWQLVSLDPLHIEPSVLCGSASIPGSGCGHHGFIRNGRWEPC